MFNCFNSNSLPHLKSYGMVIGLKAGQNLGHVRIGHSKFTRLNPRQAVAL